MNPGLQIENKDRRTLRDLARRVDEIAAQPIMTERKLLWGEHNSLLIKRPLMLVFPEGAWVELIPEESLICEGMEARTPQIV